jgi:hypothetical protein
MRIHFSRAVPSLSIYRSAMLFRRRFNYATVFICEPLFATFGRAVDRGSSESLEIE